jgi:hypothetical protein
MSFYRERLDRSLFVAGVFIDLRKALGCVDHGLLLSKMYKDVRGDVLILYSNLILKIGCKLFRPMDLKANPRKLRQVWCRVVFFPRNCLIYSSILCLIFNSTALFRCMRMTLL